MLRFSIKNAIVLKSRILLTHTVGPRDRIMPRDCIGRMVCAELLIGLQAVPLAELLFIFLSGLQAVPLALFIDDLFGLQAVPLACARRVRTAIRHYTLSGTFYKVKMSQKRVTELEIRKRQDRGILDVFHERKH